MTYGGTPNKRFEQNARSYNDLKALSVCSNATRWADGGIVTVNDLPGNVGFLIGPLAILIFGFMAHRA